ncbi:hypothetical protein EHQ12_13735 [Leptospira gomenensis]|uniref:Lipoprotein n=1 Tax=Leptospira gomenensis TaxID=2484974 RepID=A0A5F1Y725_9LEPT|nr:hypothetical protein [Leptospira gomenensis]TGK28026.1 hypothetical protein EHQ17_18230 [Leptospira gomenensis]TGK37119.1 hypothetical protein EHQ12_13735 [Leptospira gomenensis]TGK45755.1 hypothetical protein EHQ07_08745 [Leptospira gomenensis]TGK59694.1 hypothetical protein EHQ13_12955 [Leptospira gomenensis]
MKSFADKKNKILFLLCISAFLPLFSCVQKKPTQADYWKRYLEYQKSVQKEYPTGGIRNALFGNLTSEDEPLLKNENGILFLNLYLQKTERGFQPVLTGDPIPDDAPYKIHAEYLPSSFQDVKTYKLKRKTVSVLPAYSYADFFRHADRFQNFLKKESADSAKLASISAAHRYLCTVSRCDCTRSESSSLLSYTLNDDTREEFPNFYKRFYKLLNQISYKITIFKSGEFLNGIELYNEKEKTFLKIPDTESGYWANPKILHIRISLFIEAYGLKIDIRNLGYRLSFFSSKNREKIIGEFSRIPERKISGRFLRIFPPGVVDWFIPGNMDEYFDRYFSLLVQGSDGKGGSRFRTESVKTGNTMKVILNSEAEIFRERFSPFRSGETTEDRPSFWEVLEKILIEDLS